MDVSRNNWGLPLLVDSLPAVREDRVYAETTKTEGRRIPRRGEVDPGSNTRKLAEREDRAGGGC
jgi:hypothetical protein